MLYFAAISPTELVPIFGILAAMLTAFYALVRFILKQAEKDRDADRTERKSLVKAIDDMASSNREIAEATRIGNKEAKERNGHLAEITIQSRDQVLSAIGYIKEQKVEHQTVVSQDKGKNDGR
jgi:hypothetical protein